MAMDPNDDAEDHPTILVGHIYHSVSKNVPIKRSECRKRPRPFDESKNHETKNDDNKGKNVSNASNTVHFDKESSQRGFFLILQEKKYCGEISTTAIINGGIGSPSNGENNGVVQNHDTENIEFALVVPLPSLRTACYAAATRKLVRITQYTLIRYSDCWGEIILESSARDTFESYPTQKIHARQEKYTASMVIEIHHDGLSFETIGETNSNPLKETRLPGNDSDHAEKKISTPILTLEMAALKEEQHEKCNNSKDGKNKKRRSNYGKESMNITGVVDAISPILVNHTNEEPFAIMEIYQPHSHHADGSQEDDEHSASVTSAVAVIRGERALCMHPAIQPGHSITLIGVVSRKWKVPEGFCQHLNDEKTKDKSSGLYHRLRHRAPDRVILVVDSSSIRWNDDCAQDTMMPSTVESLTCVRGIVKSINFHHSGTSDKRRLGHVAHFVTLELLAPSKDATLEDESILMGEGSSDERDTKRLIDRKLARIYFTKHSMPPNLIIGIQPGAILRGINIHPMPRTATTESCTLKKQADDTYFCYMSCLRSTITIECCAGERNHLYPSEHPRFFPVLKPFSLIPDHRITGMHSDPWNSKSTAQYLYEEKFRAELKSNWCGICKVSKNPSRSALEVMTPTTDGGKPNQLHSKSESLDPTYSTFFFNTAVDALLERHSMHHYHTVNDFGQLTATKSDGILGSKTSLKTMRDPYAEFFDHAHDTSACSEKECGNSRFIAHPFCNQACSAMPFVAGINDIRNECAQNFISRVRSFVQTTQQSILLFEKEKDSESQGNSRSGLTFSHQYQVLDLRHMLGAKSFKDDTSHKDKVQKKIVVSTELDSVNIYTWGNFEFDRCESNSESFSASVYGNNCKIPISTIQESYALENGGFHVLTNRAPSSGWLQIESVFVSCLCLGPLESLNLNKNNQTKNAQNIGQSSSGVPSQYAFLPSTSDKSGRTFGHEFVFLVGNSVFIASIHFTTRSIITFDQSSCGLTSIEHNSNIKRMAENSKLASCHRQGTAQFHCSPSTASQSILSIQECLEQTLHSELKDDSFFILGRLVRQRFKLRKLKSAMKAGYPKSNCNEKSYEGWTITLSHISNTNTNNQCDERISTFASMLQTIDVQILVPFIIGKSGVDSLNALKIAIMKLPSVNDATNCDCLGSVKGFCDLIRPDQTTMGSAWRAASGLSQILPILSGGWDEFNNQLLAGNNNSAFDYCPSVYVKIPLSSRTFSKLGYQRFQCHLHEIESFFVIESNIPNSYKSHSISSPLYSLLPSQLHFRNCTGKFLPGMINRRLCRVPPAMFNVGTDAKSNQPRYVSKNQFSLLTRLICQGGVRSVTLAELHWDVCDALKQGNNADIRPSLLRRICNVRVLGISFCRVRCICTQCFQFLTSTGMPSSKGDKKRLNSPTVLTSPRNPIKSNLICPSGCSFSSASLQWECSAIIDDGTGQAKLYAEREAALLLLGDTLDVAAIETGAWVSEEGVLFQPSLPASSHLIHCIKEASSTTRKHNIINKGNKNQMIHNKESHLMHNLLPADAKAEYLLQYHCRQWYQRHYFRKMDVFCRCKPLSEDATSVNQTEIQVAKAWVAKVGIDFGSALTSTLPPLKLTLEDACLTSEINQDDDWSGWDLLKTHLKKSK